MWILISWNSRPHIWRLLPSIPPTPGVQNGSGLDSRLILDVVDNPALASETANIVQIQELLAILKKLSWSIGNMYTTVK